LASWRGDLGPGTQIVSIASFLPKHFWSSSCSEIFQNVSSRTTAGKFAKSNRVPLRPPVATLHERPVTFRVRQQSYRWNGGGVYICVLRARRLAKTGLSAAAASRNTAAAATVIFFVQLDEAKDPEPPKPGLWLI
jgi:hypothetical protein